jgi:uncharacterized membrane protein YphA (DoxX/SURF4 family)
MTVEQRTLTQGAGTPVPTLRREGDSRLLIRRGLFALRLALGVNILYWGIIALEGPARGKILFADLPGFSFGPEAEAAVLLAVGEIALGVFIAMGLLRTLSYGLGFFLQAIAVFASHIPLLTALQDQHALYATTVPVLVAQGVLFILRTEDRTLSLDAVIMDWQRAGRRDRH